MALFRAKNGALSRVLWKGVRQRAPEARWLAEQAGRGRRGEGGTGRLHAAAVKRGRGDRAGRSEGGTGSLSEGKGGRDRFGLRAAGREAGAPLLTAYSFPHPVFSLLPSPSHIPPPYPPPRCPRLPALPFPTLLILSLAPLSFHSSPTRSSLMHSSSSVPRPPPFPLPSHSPLTSPTLFPPTPFPLPLSILALLASLAISLSTSLPYMSIPFLTLASLILPYLGSSFPPSPRPHFLS